MRGSKSLWSQVRLGNPDDPLLAALGSFLWHLLRALIGTPIKTWSLVRMSRRFVNGFKPRLAWIRARLPLVMLDVDVIHFEWTSAAVNFSDVPSLLDRPTVVSCRGTEMNVWPHIPERVEIVAGIGHVLIRADAVHCVSEAMRATALELGARPDRTTVIYSAVEAPEYVTARPKSGGPLRIVMVGALRWIKGHEYALVGLRRLLDRGVPADLTIVGDGPDRQRVLFTIDDLGLKANAQLVGHVAAQDVAGHLNGADVLLSASVQEGLPNVILEAFACGLPVVATDCGGVAEVVEEGTGILVPARDPDAVANALADLARDPERRLDLGRAGRRMVEQRFTLDRLASEFLDLYGRCRV